jgi:hypothetical protein
MGLDERGRYGFGPAARLPAEIQDLLGIRFFNDLPEGPIRDSVEGYLAMPESRRGPNSIARRIVADAVSRERERVRRERPSFRVATGSQRAGASDDGANMELPPDTIVRDRNPDRMQGPGLPGSLASSGIKHVPGIMGLPGAGTGVTAHRSGSGTGATATPPSPGTKTGGTPGTAANVESSGTGATATPPASDTGATPTLPGPGTEAASNAAAPHTTVEGRPHTLFEFAESGAVPEEPSDRLPEDVVAARHSFGDYRLLHARRDLQGMPTGWPTAFPELDRNGMRFVPGNLYMVEGPVASGKTSLLLEILRRHASLVGHGRESSAPAVFLPGGERSAEAYARLLRREATAPLDGGERRRELPSSAVHRWLREGEALSDRDGALLDGAARRLDQLIATGRFAIANRADAELYGGDLVAWLRAATTESDLPHSLVLIDDLHAWMTPPGPRAGSRRERTVELISALHAIARGGRRGRGFAVPVVFSIATELNGHPGTVSMVDPGVSAAEVRGILRLTPPEDGASGVTLAKNDLGPSGVTFLLDLARPAADR